MSAVLFCAWLSLLGAAVTGPSAVPGTSGTPTTKQGGLSDRTAATLRHVASSNLFEIGSSPLARSRPNVKKEFADRMVGEHTRTTNGTRQVLNEMGTSRVRDGKP